MEAATTCSTRNVALVRSLGADHMVADTQTCCEEVLSNDDLAVDAVGGEIRGRSKTALKRGGRIVSSINNIAKAMSR